MEKMGEDDLRTALSALGERLRTRTDIVVGAFVRHELPRLQLIDPTRSLRIQSFLDQA
jgi:hypothetical protein